jgi:hypothetical protein
MPDEKAENITDVEQQTAPEENPLTSVGRSVGSVIGTVASGASKVLSISQTTEPKAAEQDQSGKRALSRRDPPQDKRAQKRVANAQKKKKAHRRKLKRPNTRG